MADVSKIQPTTAFTRAFSDALREVMSHRGVTGKAVASKIGRNPGFVSERTSGLRPCDTDIIAGIAEVASEREHPLVISPQMIVSEALAEMAARGTLRSSTDEKLPPPDRGHGGSSARGPRG